MEKRFALIDGNNFYCSCELLFRPDLRGKPIVVLSNNDGCAVSRSGEAKALGVKMGEPLHLFKDKVRENGIKVFSSNYSLYGDISRRVASTIAEFSPHTEIYSIDETFVDLSGFGGRMVDHAADMRATVLRNVGIPTCVGIGSSKTLAKLGNFLAKKNPVFNAICDLTNPEIAAYCMERTEAGEVWGVGRQTTAKLAGIGIHTVAQLRDMPLPLARKLGSVVLERTVAELRGISCLDLQEIEPTRKGMAVTRSAGNPMTSLAVLQQALTSHATRAAEKLRNHGLVASHVQVFFNTNPFSKTAPQHSVSRSAKLSPPTNATLPLVQAVMSCSARGWKGDPAGNEYAYSKSGVILDDLIPAELAPVDLFAHEQERSGRLSAALDAVNDRWGRKSLIVASEGFKRPFETKADMRSPRWTTRISDLPTVRA